MPHFCGASMRQETVEITTKANMNAAFCKGKKPHFAFVVPTSIDHGCKNESN
jgi:hypothetical protein